MKTAERAEEDHQKCARAFPLEKPPIASAERFAWVPIIFFCGTIGVLVSLRLEATWNPPHLLPALNIFFLTCVSFLVSVLAARSYLAGQSIGFLLLGCGTLALGLAGALVALPLARSTPNWIVTSYNTGACLAGACHLVSAVRAFSADRSKPSSSWMLLVRSYLAIIAIIAILATAAYYDRLPIFFVEG